MFCKTFKSSQPLREEAQKHSGKIYSSKMLTKEAPTVEHFVIGPGVRFVKWISLKILVTQPASMLPKCYSSTLI